MQMKMIKIVNNNFDNWAFLGRCHHMFLKKIILYIRLSEVNLLCGPVTTLYMEHALQEFIAGWWGGKYISQNNTL